MEKGCRVAGPGLVYCQFEWLPNQPMLPPTYRPPQSNGGGAIGGAFMGRSAASAEPPSPINVTRPIKSFFIGTPKKMQAQKKLLEKRAPPRMGGNLFWQGRDHFRGDRCPFATKTGGWWYSVPAPKTKVSFGFHEFPRGTGNHAGCGENRSRQEQKTSGR